MKPLLIWLAAVAVIFGGYAVVTSLLEETTQVFVFVDSSNPMAPVWSDVTRELDRIDDAERSEFALAQGQSRASELVHSWQPQLSLGNVVPFAPCSFAAVDTFPEAAEADERILITTPDSLASCDTNALVDWQIITLDP